MARDRGGAWGGLNALIGLGGGESRCEPYSGPKALMLAILEDAIRTFLSKEARAREEAESWIFGRHPPSVFSFTVVCETLGLEPKAVRLAMRRLEEREVAGTLLPRSRPNARGARPVAGIAADHNAED